MSIRLRGGIFFSMASGSYRRRGRLELRGEDSGFTRRVYLPALDFIHTEWIGSMVLLVAAVGAVGWANSPWSEGYFHLWETVLTLDLGFYAVSMDLHHWINDGLMAVFFFVVGLEIKRELLHGNLSTPREAAFPAVAALGGMVFPALVYFALNPEGEVGRGWAIPMATDIAFALGVLGLLGRRIPSTLRVFLLALAIVDDLGAILVIALFYTESVSLGALGLGAVVIAGIFILQRLGVRSVMVYGLVGVVFWLTILESGIHATIAGVILGAITPASPYFSRQFFVARARGLLDEFPESPEALEADRGGESEVILGELEELTSGTESPLERAERGVHPWSAYLVLPLFALANSGVVLTSETVVAGLGSSVVLGVVLGLTVGKTVGITLAGWLAVKTGLASLPAGVRWREVAGTALLAGIGFTVSLFITDLAFESPEVVARAKLGILVASLLAGTVGYLYLRIVTDSPEPASSGAG